MLPGLTPKALRTTTGTEVKKAHQVKVNKDPFHPSGGAGLLVTPALPLVPLLHRWCYVWGSGDQAAPSALSYSHVQGPPPGPALSPCCAWLRVQGSATACVMTVSHMCVGTFPRALKCILLSEAHLRQGLEAHWKTTHLLTPEWGGS